MFVFDGVVVVIGFICCGVVVKWRGKGDVFVFFIFWVGVVIYWFDI